MRASVGPAFLVLSCLLIGCSGADTREAQGLAKSYWTKTLAQCGESWFDDYNEYINVQISTWPERLDRSDELNSITWKGYSTFKSEAFRPRSKDTWIPNSGGQTIVLKKQKGQWYYGDYANVGPIFIGKNWRLASDYNPRWSTECPGSEMGD